MSLSPAAMLVPAALLAGVLVMPFRAQAQCRLCETPTTQPEPDGDLVPLRLEVEARLDFDRVILTDTSPGRILLSPSGLSSTSGSVGTVSGRAMVGSVTVTGQPGRLVRISFPRAIELLSATGSSIRLTGLTSDLPAAARLDSAGHLTFRFGGELGFSGNVEGAYRGDIPITADYL